MIRDARTEAVGDELSARVCVIGGGAAGIALSRRLSAGPGLEGGVLLVESGERALEGVTQRLYAGRNIGLPYYDLLTCRLRYLGGTTNHWGGYCRANDPIDYLGRPELDVPAWPLALEALAPYVQQAAELLDISPGFFDPAAILADRGFSSAELIERQSSLLETKVFQLTRVLRHATEFEDALSAAPGLERVMNLSALEVVLDEAGRRVDHVRAMTTTGKTVRLRADVFVLACHAIENARILLCSDRQVPTGVGNAHGHVGRYFMEHPHIFASRMIPSDRFPQIYDYSWLLRNRVNANLSLSEAAMREHGILNYYCRFNPIYADGDVSGALERVRDGFMKPFDPDLLDDVSTLLSDLSGTANIAYGRLSGRGPRPRVYLLEHRIEQAPSPQSRVVLSDTRDSLGQRQADLDWRLADLDIRTFIKGQEVIARELSALGMGRFELEDIDRALVEARVEGHYHHIGTTRMSAQPQDGVVNADCRVHDVDNLYIAGAGVFPTSGYSGPTMMLIALALRIGDHLKTRLA